MKFFGRGRRVSATMRRAQKPGNSQRGGTKATVFVRLGLINRERERSYGQENRYQRLPAEAKHWNGGCSTVS
jgi:hypothetical protein